MRITNPVSASTGHPDSTDVPPALRVGQTYRLKVSIGSRGPAVTSRAGPSGPAAGLMKSHSAPQEAAHRDIAPARAKPDLPQWSRSNIAQTTLPTWRTLRAYVRAAKQMWPDASIWVAAPETAVEELRAMGVRIF